MVSQVCRRLGIITTLSVVAAAALAAQSRQLVSIQASGLLLNLSGRAGAQDQYSWKTGFGGEVQLRINPSAFSIGAGVQFSSHSGATSDFPDDKNKIFGVFVEPRYAFKVDSRVFRPYLAGRVALLNQSVDLQGLPGQGGFEYKASAVGVGGGAGFVVRLGPTVNFDLGAAVLSASFGNYKLRSDGTDTGEPAGSGAAFLMKAGLNIGLGK